MTFDVQAYLSSLSRFGLKPGLERIRSLLRHLGDPQDDFRTVHIGGTNGKGSISAMTAAVLQAAGYRVGLYTSPHLVHYNERIRVDGAEISDADLSRLMHQVSLVAAQVSEEIQSDPTEFEIGTAVAFLYFRQQNVDVAVIEVGLGGRLDSTNVIASSAVGLASIGLDHTNVLGDDVTKIAQEKAGIFRPDKPVVIGPQSPQVEAVLKEAADALGCPVTWVRKAAVPFGNSVPEEKGRGSWYQPQKWNATGSRFDVATPWGTLRDVDVSLVGVHQIDNAATAATLALSLNDEGFSVPEEAVRKGLSRTRWPGRLDLYPGSPRLLFDGVHNPGGALVLAQSLTTLFSGETIVYMMAVLSGKDVEGMLEPLLPLGAHVVFTRPETSRIPAIEPEALAAKARSLGFSAQWAPTSAQALEQARNLAGPGGIVCICGSLYLVGEVMGMWHKEKPGVVP